MKSNATIIVVTFDVLKNKRIIPDPKKITPQKAITILGEQGIYVIPEKAIAILDFMYLLVELPFMERIELSSKVF